MSYSDVIMRFLRNDERLISVSNNTFPLVIEAKEQKELAFLTQFLDDHSTKILCDIKTHGAILLRGFHINSTAAFEKTVLSIRGMQGISHFFMSEPGRAHVDNLKYVFHTNTLMKTGGGVSLGGFHNENYYSPDVPSYISFYCLKPPKWGGETGLIHMGSVYEKLDLTLKEKLEEKAFFVAKWPISFVSERYKISNEDVKKLCGDFGLNVNNDFITMSKPSVIDDTDTKKKIIQANLCAELPALNEAILNLFIKDYRGIKWAIHKLVWKILGYHKQRKWSFMLKLFFSNPFLFLKKHKVMKKKINQYKAMQSLRISSVFKDEDLPILANLMKDNYSAFTWQANDVLIVDNIQVAHAGMPGLSSKKYPREIRAMLCNPLKLNYSDQALGLQKRQPILSETLGEQIHKMSLTQYTKGD